MEQQTIKCAFCKGKGANPHFKGTCPVCKGSGKNQVTLKYMACGDCRGSGQKRGTTLTCYTCVGLGVVPDTRDELRQARQEIRKIQAEMVEERAQLTEKQPSDNGGHKVSRRRRQRRKFLGEDMEEDWQTAQDSEHTKLCQSCATSTNDHDLIKVCLVCFGKIKFVSEEIKQESL